MECLPREYEYLAYREWREQTNPKWFDESV